MEKYFKQDRFNGKRIVLFGPESTGKTTLAKQLASHYQEPYVAEFMRNYLQCKWDVYGATSDEKDIIPIAKGQIALENQALDKAKKLLICDTNLLEIATYTSYYFKEYTSTTLMNAIHNHRYDYYFLTYIDVPWQADDLRDRPNDRWELFCIFEAVLLQKGVPFTILKGDQQTRFKTAKKIINTLINS